MPRLPQASSPQTTMPRPPPITIPTMAAAIQKKTTARILRPTSAHRSSSRSSTTTFAPHLSTAISILRTPSACRRKTRLLRSMQAWRPRSTLRATPPTRTSRARLPMAITTITPRSLSATPLSHRATSISSPTKSKTITISARALPKWASTSTARPTAARKWTLSAPIKIRKSSSAARYRLQSARRKASMPVPLLPSSTPIIKTSLPSMTAPSMPIKPSSKPPITLRSSMWRRAVPVRRTRSAARALSAGTISKSIRKSISKTPHSMLPISMSIPKTKRK